MPKIEIDLTKCLAQELAMKHLLPGNVVCIPWGRGIGKSWITRLWWYLLVAKWDGKLRPGAESPGVRIVCLMPTLVQAKKVHANLLIAELNGMWKCLRGELNKTEWRITFPGGSWIQFVSADVADNSRGIRCDAVSVDEADDVDPEIVDSVTQPWFSEPHSLRITLIGGTPRRGRFGLLYKAAKCWPSRTYWESLPEEDRPSADEIEELISSHFSFHATAYDAPLLVDPRYLKQVKRKTLHSVFAREWMCDFDSAEGLVFPMFSEDIHVREPTEHTRFERYLVGIDHGYEDPAVVLLLGVIGHGKDAVVWALQEYCKSHQTIENITRDGVLPIHEEHPYAKWYADSSGPSQIASYERAINRRIFHATHKIEDGIAVVANMLSLRTCADGKMRPNMYISRNCPNLIKELGMYRRKRDPRNKETILEDIEDKWNHSLDSLRYPTFHEFGGVYNVKTVYNDYASYYEQIEDK